MYGSALQFSPCRAPSCTAVLQALSVLDTLVVDGTEKLDVRNKNEASLPWNALHVCTIAQQLAGTSVQAAVLSP